MWRAVVRFDKTLRSRRLPLTYLLYFRPRRLLLDIAQPTLDAPSHPHPHSGFEFDFVMGLPADGPDAGRQLRTGND